MAAVSLVTPTLAGSGVAMSIVQTGEAVGVSMPVYRSSDGKYYKALNGSVSTAAVVGLAALVSSADEDWIPIITSGPVNIATASLTVGTTYFLGSTAGEVEIYGDNPGGEAITVLGTAITTSAIDLKIAASGNTK